MRKGLLLILVLVLFTVSGAALAQDTTFCGDLSAEDCAILDQAQTAMQGLSAASFDLFVDVQVQADGEDVPISLVGSGTYSGALPMDDMTGADMGNMEDAIAALRDFNGELMITLTMPQEAAGDANIPNTFTLELRLVDGVGYINFDPLQSLINDPSFTGWGGLDLASLIDALLEQNPGILSQFGGMAMGGVNPMAMGQIDQQAVEQYLSITRTDDGAGSTAMFEITVDFAGLMTDPAFQEMMRSQMESQMGEDMSETDRQEAMAMMDEMFQNANFLIHEEIDTVSGRIQSLSVEFDLDMSELDDDANDGSVSVTAILNYDYENVMTISAPENASVFPYQQLLGMLGGMMGDMGDAMGETQSAAPGDSQVSPPLATEEPTPAG